MAKYDGLYWKTLNIEFLYYEMCRLTGVKHKACRWFPPSVDVYCFNNNIQMLKGHWLDTSKFRVYKSDCYGMS